ncbi:DUF1707 domain-containing protein [Nocardia sp. NPDC050799]|uniref:DUF1707 SHOCT-like domain-containing protein n=1 Tax=Nocardia sp. NPDC050799 TaxID=3154842 RepID=UPI003401A0A5
MSTVSPGRLRARDIDRAETATVLDGAYAEGQLGAAEYHDRIAQARAAKTLGELSELVADLQTPDARRVRAERGAAAAATASGYPPGTRARTADRDAAGAVLSRALAEGQLAEDEYHVRAELLADVVTLDDLAELTADLQGARPAPVAPPPVRSGGQGRYFAVIGAAGLAVAFGTFALVHREAEPAPAVPPAAAAPAPVPYAALNDIEPLVIPTPDLVTAAGLAHFVDRYRIEFGDTVADEITLFPAHARVTRALPGQPNRKVTYTYRGGFHQDSDPTTRPVDTPTVDLAAVDIAAIGAAAGTAAATTRVPDGVVSMIEVDVPSFDPLAGRPAVSIHVGNTFDESGWFVLSPAGEVLRVWPFDG